MVTACQPAPASACICCENSSGGTYRPGNGAPAGGGAITWYMRIGTGVGPGRPVPRAGVAAVVPAPCAAGVALPAGWREAPAGERPRDPPDPFEPPDPPPAPAT